MRDILRDRYDESFEVSGSQRNGPESEEQNRLVESALNLFNENRDLSAVLSLSPDLQRMAALKLIESGKGWAVAINLDKFQGLDKEIALKLIEAKEVDYTAYVSDLDLDQKTAFELIEVQELDFTAYGIEKFQDSDYTESALKIFKAWQEELVAHNIDKFQGLDKEIALKLIEVGKESAVVFNLYKFQGLDKEIALKLIEVGRGRNVAECLDKFQGLDKEIALKFIEVREGYCIVQNLEKFQGLDHKEVALKLIESGQIWAVEKNLEKFQGEIFEEAKTNSQAMNLSELEYILALQNGQAEFTLMEAGEKYKRIFSRLVEGGLWNDEQNIVGPFRAGAEIFGYERMFAYLGRKDLSRHHGLHAFGQILHLYQISGLSADRFYGNILNQVAKDDSFYKAGTAHHELNQIAQSFNSDIAGILKKAKQYPKIKNLAKLAESLNSSEEIFVSWKNLKRYNELTRLLGQTDLLEKMENEPSPKMREYIETLALHPDSGVDMQKVFQFWQNPSDFLNLPDSHTPKEIHNRKKPSNLAEIPHLDLTAEDLRDALVFGSLDSIQAFTPMEAKYELELSLRARLSLALGNFKERIPGQAVNPKKLFKQVLEIMKPLGISVVEYLDGKDIPKEAETKIEDLLKDTKVGFSQKAQESLPKHSLVMRIGAKSDPSVVLAGNDTACCMPFGSGKNNVYTFNPACAQAVLQVEREEGKARTIAQSVLTKDKDIGMSVPEAIEALRNSGEEHLNQVVPEEILRSAPRVLACDNVEVSPNFKSGNYPKLIEAVYRDFFAEYLKRYAKEQGLRPDETVVGLGYSDTLSNLPTNPNTTIPEAPVGYSDKTHDRVIVLKTAPHPKSQFVVLKRQITEVSKQTESKEKISTPVSDLTYEDTLPVAYIEGKAYADNMSLMEYMWKLENTLIAKDIANAHKHRTNMSFKYESQGKMRGYMIAYEGVADKEVKPGKPGAEPVIYIADLAVAEPGSIGGGRAGAAMIKAFVERYGNEYLLKGRPVPIMAYAREQTSYKLIKKELERFSKELKMEFVLEEGAKYSQGGDSMHTIVIRPQKIQKE